MNRALRMQWKCGMWKNVSLCRGREVYVLSAREIDGRIAKKRSDCRRPHVLCGRIPGSQWTVQGWTARHSG